MADNMEHQTERAYQKQHGVNAGCVAATTLGHGRVPGVAARRVAALRRCAWPARAAPPAASPPQALTRCSAHSFHSRKKKVPGKAGARYYKNVGLGFKTPREAIEGARPLPPRGAGGARRRAACALRAWLRAFEGFRVGPWIACLPPLERRMRPPPSPLGGQADAACVRRRHIRGPQVPVHQRRVHPWPHPDRHRALGQDEAHHHHPPRLHALHQEVPAVRALPALAAAAAQAACSSPRVAVC